MRIYKKLKISNIQIRYVELILFNYLRKINKQVAFSFFILRFCCLYRQNCRFFL
jgi:hypothetical protein